MARTRTEGRGRRVVGVGAVSGCCLRAANQYIDILYTYPNGLIHMALHKCDRLLVHIRMSTKAYAMNIRKESQPFCAGVTLGGLCGGCQGEAQGGWEV